jgi:succinoglycan biosynthesis transport protein ExoP
LAQYDINLREYWRILKKRKFVVILITIALGIFSTIFAILQAPRPLYTTVCIIEIKKAPAFESLYPQKQTWSDSDEIETQMTVIKSYAVFQKVAEKMGLIPRGVSQGDRQLRNSDILIIENLQAKVEVKRERYSSILHIKVTDSSPAAAKQLADTIASTYRDLHAEQQVKRTAEALKYIAEQLNDVRGKLRESEEEFNKFSKDNELVSIDFQGEKLLARIQEIHSEITKLTEEKREIQQLLQRVNDFIAHPTSSDIDFYSAKASSRYQSINETFVGLVLKRETLLKEYTSKHPEVIAISQEIAENASKMALTLQQQIKGIQQTESELKEELESINAKTKVLLDKKLEYNRLKRKVELYTDMIVLLERKNQEALIKRAERPEEVNIVKPALMPREPINPPHTATNGALGVVIGLVFGLLVAFVVETFDTSLGAIEDVEQTLGTQVLGVIPQVDPENVRESLKKLFPGGPKLHSQKEAVNLVSHFVPNSMMAENFRAIRTNIDFKDVEKRLKTLIITSSSPLEGKSLIATNLAIVMAQAGRKTLLIGSDLRKPTVAKIFGVESTPGLTEILLGNSHWRDTLRTVTDLVMGHMTLDEVTMTPGLDKLHFITSGSIPANPAEIVDSVRFVDFVEEAKREYDLIIFDTPPILSAADAVIIGTKVDGVLLVYRIGAVSRMLLRRAVNQVRQVKGNIMGVILNGMRAEVSPDFQDYKHYKYYHAYGQEGESRGDRKRKVFSWLDLISRSPKGIEEIQAYPETKALQKEQRKQSSILRLSLVVAAVALLGAGFLYGNGAIDSTKRPGTGKPMKNVEQIATDRGRISTGVKREKPPNGAPGEPQSRISMGNPPTAPALSSEAPIPRPATIRETDTGRSASHGGFAPLPYSVYLGSFHKLESAKKAIARYATKGCSSYYVKVLLRKGERYRLYAGHFENREQGKKLIDEKGFKGAKVKETPWANLIGIYTSNEELEKKMKALRELDYSPYVVKDSDGKDWLYVGAFYPRERAERLYKELGEKGIENKVVER